MTTIEWTEETWNPLRAKNIATGANGHFCVKVSPGCKNCYAERLQPRYRNFARYAAQDRDQVELFLDDEVLRRPLRWKRGREVFPCSMTDLFGDFYPDAWIDRVIAIAALTPRHTYQCLTKRADRMGNYFSDGFGFADRVAQEIVLLAAEFSLDANPAIGAILKGAPPNWRQGVSVEDNEQAKERLPHLDLANVAFRWVSIEPILADVDLRAWLEIDRHIGSKEWTRSDFKPAIDWGVVGGESGQNARTTTIGHVRGVVEQFRAAGVPIFVKQLGARPVNREGALHPVVHSKGGDPSEWPEDLRVRENPSEIKQ